ncbi:MAG: efflux RND transporter permease subunit [Bryobacterales bacterium]|nr:efflux RND transporter permease subunit [Bryobacterales bacterium]
MIDRVIRWSVTNRMVVLVMAVILAIAGVYAALDLPIDAVPDMTTNQVQINARAAAFDPESMEQYVTQPIELAMSNLPRRTALRSISQFGLSQVTVVFEDEVETYQARQWVMERLLEVREQLPAGVTPELAPVSTGLGEIVQFALHVSPDAKESYSLTELRTLLDWYIKPYLRNVPGVVEVNSYGGSAKQYEVMVDPEKLVAYRLTLGQVVEALRSNNADVGGAYLEEGGEQRIIRGTAMIGSLRDIENIVVASTKGTPVYIRSIGTVGFGEQIRHGAATRDGKGETVIGVVMMLKGENSLQVSERVVKRLEELNSTMPKGVSIDVFYDRRDLVYRTLRTALTNLTEGGLVVAAVLFLFLLQWRAGLIVSAAIPLSMLVALIGMKYFNVSANLMSLGAIDFGLIVDAAVIIVENCVRRLSEERRRRGRALSKDERRAIVTAASLEVRKASQFGEILIIAAYLPVLALAGLEGKMFRPMGFTVVLALCGALVLSLTLIPALCALFLKEREPGKEEPGTGARAATHSEEHPVLRAIQRKYIPVLAYGQKHLWAPVGGALLCIGVALWMFPRLGSEFLPKLEEGTLAIHAVRLPGVSLNESVAMNTAMEKAVMEFPEVTGVVSRIGRAEIATDPMGIHLSDNYVFLKPIHEWTNAGSREELIEQLERKMSEITSMAYTFSQPIEFRMLELVEGVGSRSDVVVKIFGEDLDELRAKAEHVARVLREIPGAADLKVQQVTGQPLVTVKADRAAIARYGMNVNSVQDVVQAAIAGINAGTVLEGFKRFELVLRFRPEARRNLADFGNLPVSTPEGTHVPLAQVASIRTQSGPLELSREDGQRRITVEANVRGRDIGGFVEDAQRRVNQEVSLQPGYLMVWGGVWEHLISGRERLLIAGAFTFLLLFSLLVLSFRSVGQAALIFTGIPFAVSGGILALWLRDIHFSMSAGIGFIAVSGVSVLNGVVMLSFMNQHHAEGMPWVEAVRTGAISRLRPVLMTAAVASFGFLPMAFSTGAGAEVQRPLATVVIGGLITATLLTLVVLPSLALLGQRKGLISRQPY